MIGWLLDTNVTAEIISTRGSVRVKEWAANQDEATLYLSILTIAEYDTLRRFFARHRITRKKRRHMPPSRTGRTS